MQEFHYDVWGKREFVKVYEDPYLPNWDLFGLTGRQGFTGHEMLDNVGLIHMNGRVYDPDVGRFISADPIVKAPTFTQSYNRYSYVWNNPLSLTDPSGFEPHGTGTDGYDAHPDYDSDSHSWDYSGGSDRNDAVATNHRVLDGGVIHLEPLIVDGNEYDYPTDGDGDGDGDGAQKSGFSRYIDRSIAGFQTLGNLNELGRQAMRMLEGIPGASTVSGGFKFASVLMVARAATQKHHLIPKAVFKRYKNLLPDAYKRDHAANLMTLPTPFHGNHPSYSRYVESKLSGLLQNGPITMDQMTGLQTHLRNKLDTIQKSGAYERFNQYFKDQGY